MSNNQKNNSPLLEDGRIRKELSKRFGKRRYLTFREGINFFLPEEYQDNFPLSIIINRDLFDTLKQDVKSQDLKTFNDIEDVKQIIAYDPVAELEKSKSQWSALRAVEMKWRNMKRYGSIDKERKLSPSEILDEKIIFFCSKIKIEREILICYIIDHIDLFSSEIEIPPKLQNFLSTVKEFSTTMENKEVIKPTKEEVEELLMNVSPELERLYDTAKDGLDKIKYTTSEEICSACHEAYQKMTESQEPIDKIEYLLEFSKNNSLIFYLQA